MLAEEQILARDSALKVARDIPERMEIVGLAANANARKLADHYVILRRGEIVLSGAGADMERDNVRNFLSV